MFMGTLSCGLLYELTWKGEYYTRHCLIILFCLFLSSNALHVAANSHEASALAYSVAPELVRHIRRMENRFGFTQGKWGLRWLGKSSAPMATTSLPPPISWKKEKRSPFLFSCHDFTLWSYMLYLYCSFGTKDKRIQRVNQRHSVCFCFCNYTVLTEPNIRLLSFPDLSPRYFPDDRSILDFSFLWLKASAVTWLPNGTFFKS